MSEDNAADPAKGTKAKAPTPTADLLAEAKRIAEEAAQAAVAALGVRAPELGGELLAALKTWVRAELELMQQGHGPEARQELNP